MSRRRRAGPRLSALPIVVVIMVLLVGTLATTLTFPTASPSPTPAFPTGAPAFPDVTAPPTETPMGRYPTSTEAGLVSACTSGLDPGTVPVPIGQAFCVCTVNMYEQLYPTLEQFQSANASGAITDQLKTDVANRCAQKIVGG